jgi:predicted aspartyl protease
MDLPTARSSVALNSARTHAKQLGLNDREKVTSTMIATASGASQAQACRLVLYEISAGKIRLH